MSTVGIVLYPQALLGSVVVPAEMLMAADQIARARHRNRERLRLQVASLDGAPDSQDAPLDGALGLRINCLPQDIRAPDLVFLPGLWRNPLPVVRRHGELGGLLHRWAAGGSLICSVGTGSCFLAEAGLLDGRPATTHWAYLEQFALQYPHVQLKRHHLTTRSGNFYCAGSINSVADLTGHFIERLYGAAIACQVAAHFSPEVRRSHREHGFFEGEPNRHHDELMVDVQHWLQQHYDETVDFASLSGHFGLSQRSLNRRFAAACGCSPGRYLQQLRLQQASALLRESNLSVAAIAAAVGYQDFGYFSTLFRERMAQTPSQYRRAVRGKLFDPDRPARA